MRTVSAYQKQEKRDLATLRQFKVSPHSLEEWNAKVFIVDDKAENPELLRIGSARKPVALVIPDFHIKNYQAEFIALLGNYPYYTCVELEYTDGRDFDRRHVRFSFT